MVTRRHVDSGLVAVDTLVAVGDVEEEILLVMLLIESSHGGAGRGDDVVDKEEEGILGSEVDALADEEVELSDSEIRGDEVLLLVQVSNARLGRLLHNHGNPVWILLPDLLPLGASLLERVLLLVFPTHLVHFPSRLIDKKRAQIYLTLRKYIFSLIF